MTTYRTIDLFAGAGGLSRGFALASDQSNSYSFEPVYAVEHDEAAARTYKSNFGCQVYTGDIELLDVRAYPEAEIVLGGPPCQGFSPLGRDRDDLSRAELNGLWEHYFNAVAAVEPLAFVVENVPEFQSSGQFNELLHRMDTDSFLKEFDYGYGVLNAADYGVPQSRRRGLFVAVRGAAVQWPPTPSHGAASPGGVPHRTVRDVIADLPSMPTTLLPELRDDGSQDLHIKRNPTAKSLARYRTIPPGGNRFDLMRERPDITPACWLNKPSGTTDVMGRMWWDRPSPTIRTEFYKPEKGRYLHPVHDRPITHREAARIQTFPDDFFFEGTKIEIGRQIGNAVPPELGAALGRFIGELLARTD